MADAIGIETPREPRAPTSFLSLPPEARPPESRLGDLPGAAFRMSNDVNALFDLLYEPTFPPDPTFDPFERAKQSPYYLNYGVELAQAQSEAEFQMKEWRIRRELEDRQIIAGQGWLGFGAAMLAQLVSPTSLIPLIGEARGVRGVAQAFGLAAAVSSAQEGVIYASHETGTKTEAFTGIAAGTVLGGLMGSAAVYLRPHMVEKAIFDLEQEADEAASAAVHFDSTGHLKVTAKEDPTLQVPGGEQRFDVPQVDREGFRFPEHQVADGLPAPAPGHVRFYKIEDQGDGVSPVVTTNYETALGSVPPGGKVSYVDLPRGNQDEILMQAWDEMATPDSPGAGVAYMEAALSPESEAKLRPIEPQTGQAPEPQSLSAKSALEPEVPYLARVQPGGKVVYEPAYEGPPRAAGEMNVATGVEQIDRALVATSPVARAINQFDQPIKAPGIAKDMHVLSDSGLTWRGAEVGVTGATEGTVEHRIIHYQALLARGMRIVRDAYTKYMFEGKQPTVQRVVEVSVLRFFNRAPKGKMKFSEFSEKLTDALNLADRSDVPEIQDAARKIRADVFETVNTAAREAEEKWDRGHRLYKELEEDPDKSYMSHVFSPDKVRADFNGFITLVSNHYRKAMFNYYRRQMEKLQSRVSENEEYANILRMGQDEAQRIYDENKEALRRAKPYTDEESRIVDQIETLEWERNTAYRRHLDDLMDQEEQEFGFIGPEKQTQLEERARTLADEERQELSVKIHELEQKAPPRVELSRKEQTQARRRMRYAMQAVGQLEKKRADALEKITKNEDWSIGALEKFLKRWDKLKAEREKISPDLWEKKVAELDASFRRAVHSLRASEDRIVKEQFRYLEEGIGREGLDKATEKGLLAERRLDRAFDSLTKAKAATPEARLASMAEKEAAAKQYVFDAIKRRVERNAKLRADAEGKFDPALGEARAKDLQDLTSQRIDALEETIRKAGGVDVDFKRMSMNFDQTADDLATQIAHAITGMETRISQIDLMTAFDVGARSPMKNRVLNIEYEFKKKYLEMDTEKVLQRYLNTVGADIELYRAFGDRTGGVVMKRAEQEMSAIKRLIETREVDEAGKKITPAQRRKDMIAHDRAWQRRKQELGGTIERIRHLRGMSVTPHGIGQRLGRLFLNMNSATMLGTATISSLGDPARAVMVHGLTNVFRDSLIPYIRGLVDLEQRAFNKKMIKEFRLWGIGNDVLTHQRSRNYIDTFGYDINESAFERFWQKTAHAMPMLALFGPWTDAMKIATAPATMSRIVRGIEDLADGKISQAELQYLTSVNITPQMAYRMAEQLRTPHGGTKYRGVTLPNTESWTDYEAMRVFQAAMAREDERIVLTPGLERPLFTDASMAGRIVSQFHNFTLASQTKIVASGLQSRNMAAFHYVQGAIFSLALGGLSYYLWALTHSDRSRKEMREATLAQWADQMVYRSGLLGALSDVQSIAKKIPLTRPYAGFSDTDLAGRNPGDIAEGVLGASSAKFNDIIQFIAGVDAPTEGTVRQARKILPWNNVFWLKWAFDEVERGTSDFFGLPEKRQ